MASDCNYGLIRLYKLINKELNSSVQIFRYTVIHGMWNGMEHGMEWNRISNE